MMMTQKYVLSMLFAIISFLAVINQISAYSFQIPICNPPSINQSCINFTSTAAITTAPLDGIMYWNGGYLYLTNDTIYNRTINTVITYNITNGSNASMSQDLTANNLAIFYNVTNSTFTVSQNLTANESVIKDWVLSKMASNHYYNTSFYNRSEAENTFSLKTEVDTLQRKLADYYTVVDLNARYGYLLNINTSGYNGTINLADELDSTGFNTTWKVIVIINSVMLVILLVAIVKLMTNG